MLKNYPSHRGPLRAPAARIGLMQGTPLATFLVCCCGANVALAEPTGAQAFQVSGGNVSPGVHAELPRPPVAPAAPIGEPESATGEPETTLEVSIHGKLLRQAGGAPVSATTVVSGRALSRPGQSSADVLRGVPGVQVARSGAASDFATASLRGATSAQTPIYLAGIRLNDDLAGSADLSATPLWIVDRVEVYRGNAPEFADRLGIGGAIVFTPRLPRKTQFRLGADAGSFGQRSQWTVATVGTKRSAALVGLKLAAAENNYAYVDDQGTGFDSADDRTVRRRNADSQSADLWALGRHRLGSSTLRTVFNAFVREQGINGFSVSPALHARASQRRLLVGLSLDGRCGGTPSCHYELTSQVLSARALTNDPRSEISALLTQRQEVTGLRLSERATLSYSVTEDLRLRGSFSFGWGKTRLARLESASLDATRTSLRPSLSADYQAGGVRFYGLLALECHATESSESDDRSGMCALPEAVGRLGVEKSLSDQVSVLLSAGRYARIPTVGELFGTSPVVRGNDSLEAERSLGLDVGLRAGHTLDQVRLEGEVFGFARWTDNLISYRLASLGIVRPFNLGRARNLGVETAGAVDVYSHLLLKGNATLLEPRDQSENRSLLNDQLPYRSRLVVSVGAEAYSDFSKWGLSRAYLGLNYFRRAARFADAAGLVVLPKEETVDMRAGTGLGDSKLQLSLTLRNALGAKQQDLFGAPLPGRSVHAALEGVIDP